LFPQMRPEKLFNEEVSSVSGDDSK